MKKILILLSILLALALTECKSQELVTVAGVGLFRDTKIGHSGLGNYEFVEGRLMFGNKFRLGPMASYIWAGVKDGNYKYKGRFCTLGLSLDNWGGGEFRNYYFWLNSGLRWSYDRDISAPNYSWQRDKLYYLQGGFRLTNRSRTWLNNSLLMAEWQHPTGPGEALYSTAPGVFNTGQHEAKGSVRATYENGLTRIALFPNGKKKFLEPLVHLGYGATKAYTCKYLEYGGGLSVGYFQKWYKEPVKFKVFKRQGLYRNSEASIHFEVIINLHLNLKNNQLKKEK